MLENINIINLAIVESLDLNLNQGLSVLTGETGAGKSILLTALGLALGDRAEAGFIRPNCQRAEINLSFNLSQLPVAATWLKNHELDDEHHCIIRRTIRQDGRSQAYINGRPTTLQHLKQLSSKLVEIHGQHAYLTLLDADTQRGFLDQYANNDSLLNEISACYQQWHSTHQELEQLIKNTTDQQHREELYRYQLTELEQLDLQNYDYDALITEHLKLANLEYILQKGQEQLNQLDQQDYAINSQLNQVIQSLSELSPLAQELTEPHSLLVEAQIQIQEATQQLSYFLQAQELEPQRLQSLEADIAIIQTLARKHQVQPESLPEVAQELITALDALSNSDERIIELKQLIIELEQQYFKVAQQLHEQRCQESIKLSQLISNMIQELGMPHGEFSIRVTAQENQAPKVHGMDKIDFLVSANKGLPLQPLAKVASGGELSRISLAIQVSTNSHNTPTMIFDEVDSGVGGGIAEIIGQKLRDLGKQSQVLCVTHLPQVASQAHQHLFVYKSNDDEMTTSSVKTLSPAQRIDETARMLGGLEITESTLIHAKEMLLRSTART